MKRKMLTKAELWLPCRVCWVLFPARRADAITCSTACRKAKS